MTILTRRFARLIASLLCLALLGGLFVLNRRVNRALEAPVSAERPVELAALPARVALPFWGSEDIESVVELPGGLYAAGGFGVARLEPSRAGVSGSLDRTDISSTLPTRRVAAFTAWRTDLVAGLENGGLFIYRDGAWLEVRSGFGDLHVRALKESSAGELWIGAREGLFRMGLAERVMARLHTSSTRAIALADGGRVISGGEKGLFSTAGGVTTGLRLEGVDAPWIDDLAVFAQRIYTVTPLGLYAEGEAGVLRSVAGGENIASIAAQRDHLFATADPADSGLRRFDRAGRVEVERIPSAARRVFTMGDRLMADTANGLAERSNNSWRVVSPARQARGIGAAHVGALAWFRGHLTVGFFDGGLAQLVAADPSSHKATASALKDEVALTLRSIEGASTAASPVWAVNALLDAGGALHIASLRGAFRFDGTRLSPIEGSGAAFSLAQTRSGVTIGFGEGVLLPEQKLLSAFHGLPGNQATALAAAEGGLLVGTPSGLGYVLDRTVRWRVASGEGKLPHPWITAILPLNGSVLVATYGGGITRRKGSLSDRGEWMPFTETVGLKINTACLVMAGGRVYAGSDGAGLFRMARDGTRFEPLKLALPSPRVTALFERDGFLYIGTDEGLTRWPVEGE